MLTNEDLLFQALRQHQSGNRQQAESLCREVLKTRPDHCDALHLLGVLEHEAGRFNAAIPLIRRAIDLKPAVASFHSNLGIAHRAGGQLTEAIKCYRQALWIDPQLVNAHFNLGNVFQDLGELERAGECYRKALSLKPDFGDALCNLGLVHRAQGQLDEAITCFRRAVAQGKACPNALTNLGIALKEKGDLVEAAACQEQALRLDSKHANARFNLSLLRLLQGDFDRAWSDFECRWEASGLAPKHVDIPLWDGKPLKGKTLLVYAEQALGDTLQFARYAALLRKRGAKVVLECQPGLAPLLEGVADQIIPEGELLPHIDVQAPLISLPGLMKTTAKTIPAHTPYVQSDSKLERFWRHKLSKVKGYKVGIAWQGNPDDPEDRLWSIPLERFAALADVDGVRLVSLQIGPGHEQVSSLSGFPLLDLGGRMDRDITWSDIAAAMMSLDLVVTADTPIAHLAGALGVPVWTVLAYVPEWRWQMDRADSPWYPTMRLFRQRRRGDWDEVMARVALAVPFEE
ncbi:MAG: glycosyltransferase [Proteobacteria bacterium]|nr:MAG: glycosyltransferase [Pseudomonadota bacterium]